MTVPDSIDVAELDRRRRAGEALTLLDVREPWELEICSIDGALAIPLAQLPARVGELPADHPLIVFCHHGGRSRQAVAWLRRQGLTQAINLDGGIDAWRAVDPGVRAY
jgi:rhodanese-related sulfurtransferase